MCIRFVARNQLGCHMGEPGPAPSGPRMSLHTRCGTRTAAWGKGKPKCRRETIAMSSGLQSVSDSLHVKDLYFSRCRLRDRPAVYANLSTWYGNISQFGKGRERIR